MGRGCDSCYDADHVIRVPDRRDFLKQAGSVLLLPYAAAAAKDLRCDVAVIGGGFGGVAAALAALRNGQRVVLTEETDWVGGQTTSQAVPPDEHAWIESFGCTRSYRAYRDGVREYYRRHYPLTEPARAVQYFNPGNATVSRIAHEPRVSLAVLEAMLAPYASSGRLTVLLRHVAVSADVERDRVRAVAARNLDDGTERVIRAEYFLDATELGDLLPLTRDRVRDRVRVASADRRAACTRAGPAAQHAGLHRVLRHGLSGRRGPHDRKARRSMRSGGTTCRA